MQIDERGVVRRLRVSVRYAHDDGFLQAEHVAEVAREIVEQRQLRGARIAENRGHAESAQELQDGGADDHRISVCERALQMIRQLTSPKRRASPVLVASGSPLA